uniref:TerD domain-containing protein n=1 Tax=Phaeomonas parva TaxID=124430 RepID=A0A7S1UJ16_9STRA|mmetsp:Transcript_6923/g.20226  ORF Transcript_6923/g.20226 Transcript_6923/m.20226 type:complete len:433 (+) Transcript_6923:101-1399(+)
MTEEAKVEQPREQDVAIPVSPAGEGEEMLQLGVAWEFLVERPAVELKCSMVFFSEAGEAIATVNSANLEALGGAARHSFTTEVDGLDEAFDLGLKALEGEAKVGMLVINAPSEGSLRDVKSAFVRLTHAVNDEGAVVEEIPIHCWQHENTALVVGAFYRSPYCWNYRSIAAAAHTRTVEDTMHRMRPFVDALLEPGLKFERTLEGGVGAPSLAMAKGDVAYLVGAPKLVIGLGWGAPASYDIDASVVILGEASGTPGLRHTLDIVNFSQPQSRPETSTKAKPLVRHGSESGGLGEGFAGDDNEVIFVDLAKAAPEVKELVFAVNVFNGGSFGNCEDAYVRLVQRLPKAAELARYDVEVAVAEDGLGFIFARLFRDEDHGRWGFQATGTSAGGVMARCEETTIAAGGEWRPTLRDTFQSPVEAEGACSTCAVM